MTAKANKNHPLRKALRSLRHAVEGLLQFILLAIFWVLPIDWASNLGGWLTRQIGTRVGISHRAMKHLEIAFPEMPEAERRHIVAGMWDNLGRLIAEYPHLGAIANPQSGRVEVIGDERLEPLRAAGRPFIIISAHMANFELLPIAAYKHGHNMTVVSRPVNNPFIQRILLYFRERPTGNWGKVPKGVSGARQAVNLLVQGQNLGVLVDQRVTQGVALPLFGQPARTNLGIARLALEYGVEVFPAHLERLGGAHFRLTVEAPLAKPAATDKQEAAKAMMTEANVILERWIRHRPEDWLWLHRRWDRP